MACLVQVLKHFSLDGKLGLSDAQVHEVSSMITPQNWHSCHQFMCSAICFCTGCLHASFPLADGRSQCRLEPFMGTTSSVQTKVRPLPLMSRHTLNSDNVLFGHCCKACWLLA